MSAKNLARELKILFHTFRQEPTDEALVGYREALVGLTDDEMTRARQRACAECKFMPVPAELCELAAPEVLEEPIPEITFPGVNGFKMPAGGWRALFGHFNAERQRDGEPMIDPESFPPEFLPSMAFDGSESMDKLIKAP